MLNWRVSPGGRGPGQLGHDQGGAVGGGWTPGWAERLRAAGGVSRALRQQLPWVLVESLCRAVEMAGRCPWAVTL